MSGAQTIAGDADLKSANIKKGVNIFGVNGSYTDLNFQVVKYNTEAKLLAATPAENTIGVITDTNITSWVFSATQPSSPTEGMVWVKTGSYSAAGFNALKKNGLQVCPMYAMQYLLGAWQVKTAQTYLASQWHDWNIYLYKDGNECTDLTGGWVTEAKSTAGNSEASPNAPTVTRKEDCVVISSSSGGGIHRTKNKIYINGRKKLTFFGTNTRPYTDWQQLIIWKAINGYWNQNIVAQVKLPLGTNLVTSIDISALSEGEYYIGIFSYLETNITMKQLYIE